MFVFERFDNENIIEDFKYNIISCSSKLKFEIFPRKIGFYSTTNKNILNIKYVSETQERGGPICMHFYGLIFRKKYLLGIICPEIFYTLFTFGTWFIKDEYLYFKILLLVLWVYVYISNIKNIKYIYNTLIRWMGK